MSVQSQTSLCAQNQTMRQQQDAQHIGRLRANQVKPDRCGQRQAIHGGVLRVCSMAMRETSTMAITNQNITQRTLPAILPR
jgi:hypothetical protein